MSETQWWWVREVHNFGGFFGGDTVTLSATPAPAGRRAADDAATTLVIDEKAFINVRDRHTIAPEMLLSLERAGERVERAELLAASEWPPLSAALGDRPPAAPLGGPVLRAYHCPACALWVVGAPAVTGCSVCGTALPEILPAGTALEVD